MASKHIPSNMRHYIALLSPILLSLLLLSDSQAQSSLNASGGDIQNINGSVAYSVGQVVFNTHDNITEGVQQPYEISTLVGNNDIVDVVKLRLFPNPTSHFLQLSIDHQDVSNWSYTMYSLAGASIKQGKLTNSDVRIAMADLAQATYLLTITDGKQVVKTFKIIKH